MHKEGEFASYGSHLVYTLPFYCLIFFCVDLQLVEETHQQVSLLWPLVYTIIKITQNVTFTIWMVGAMDHTIQCWILVEFEETFFNYLLLTF